ncbi:hypothetical protein QFC19_004762 [Naganishia cerealis]|uniref:Uncharacterized protein n=1 Tax=Naganishia cerealis TaxID=610337 RepID=A0ACC2VTD3_9TREE|nr:hypothetical protein QFC19_004762 [Naganishia cerealis]
MQAQRQRCGDPRAAAAEPLPPPPEAFPITEYSQLQAQSGTSGADPPHLAANPFGDSNAVSARASLSSASGSVSAQDILSTADSAARRFDREGDEQSFRDDASSLAPPPEYQEHHHELQGGYLATGVGVEAVLPSYDAAESLALQPEEKNAGNFDREQGQGRDIEPMGIDEKAELRRTEEAQQEKDLVKQPPVVAHAQEPPPPSQQQEMEQRNHLDLRAIADAIARAYTSSPQLESQRYTAPPSRQESAVFDSRGGSLRASGDASDTASLLAQQHRKGKQRASESSMGSEIVMVGGQRMTKEDEAELKKIWDQIERAHGYRLSDGWIVLVEIGLGEQTHTANPSSEAERQGRQRKAFYQELLKQTGEGRLRSQDHSPTSSGAHPHQRGRYDIAQGSSESPLAPALMTEWHQSFQPLDTPESQRSSPEIVRMLKTDTQPPGPEQPGLLLSSTTGERKPSEDELISMQDFLAKEETLITIQEFLKKELGEGKK